MSKTSKRLTVPIFGVQVPSDDLVVQAPHGVDHSAACSTVGRSKPLGANTDDLLQGSLKTSDLVS
jgi:hypothetical protein